MTLFGTITINIRMKPEECFEQVRSILDSENFEIKVSDPPNSIRAEAGREYNRKWLLITLILFFPLAFVYYFTRKKNTVNVTIKPKTDDICEVTISSSGDMGDMLKEIIANKLFNKAGVPSTYFS